MCESLSCHRVIKVMLSILSMLPGKQLDAYSPSAVGANAPEFPYSGEIPQDPESLIVAMERVTVLFDRLVYFDVV